MVAQYSPLGHTVCQKQACAVFFALFAVAAIVSFFTVMIVNSGGPEPLNSSLVLNQTISSSSTGVVQFTNIDLQFNLTMNADFASINQAQFANQLKNEFINATNALANQTFVTSLSSGSIIAQIVVQQSFGERYPTGQLVSSFFNLIPLLNKTRSFFRQYPIKPVSAFVASPTTPPIACSAPGYSNLCSAPPTPLVNGCLGDPCLNGGVCSNVTVAPFYNCACPTGFTSTNCSISACTPNPCQNGAPCMLSAGSYNCTCPPGFGGINCTQAITVKFAITEYNSGGSGAYLEIFNYTGSLQSSVLLQNTNNYNLGLTSISNNSIFLIGNYFATLDIIPYRGTEQQYISQDGTFGDTHFQMTSDNQTNVYIADLQAGGGSFGDYRILNVTANPMPFTPFASSQVSSFCHVQQGTSNVNSLAIAADNFGNVFYCSGSNNVCSYCGTGNNGVAAFNVTDTTISTAFSLAWNPLLNVLYMSNLSGQIYKITLSGVISLLIDLTSLEGSQMGIAFDISTNRIYAVGYATQHILSIATDGSSYTIIGSTTYAPFYLTLLH